MKMTHLSCGGQLMLVAILLAAALGCTGSLTSCRSNGSRTPDSTANVSGAVRSRVHFNADSAYKYVKNQVAFGPRVPGSASHDKCADYLVQELKSLSADSVWVQKFTLNAYNGDKLPLTNIMARFNGAVNTANRILLIAHYDSRPWADRERRAELATEAVVGANDGASGVGVILELARQFREQRPSVGVDVLFTDGEDYGDASGWSNNDSTWCLGTQYWTRNLPADYYEARPRYGILLDMVGSPTARFHREYISDLYASNILDKVWGVASNSGYSNYFVNQQGGSVVDDHLFINGIGIPTIDIIDVNNEATGNFPPTWHTADDTMDGISVATLGAVGQTVANVIYFERP